MHLRSISDILFVAPLIASVGYAYQRQPLQSPHPRQIPAYDGDPRSTTLEAKTMDSNVATKRAAARTQRPFILTYAEQVRAWSAYCGGSQGAAGPCKRISPVTDEVVEVIQAR